MRDIDPAHLIALNAGRAEARTLTEALAIDHPTLLSAAVPDAPPELATAAAAAQRLGVLARMTAIGTALSAQLPPERLGALAAHPSDTVRGWACFAVGAAGAAGARGAAGGPAVRAVLDRIRPLADDPSFTVREWAWMAVRPTLVAELPEAITALASWTTDPSPRLRRFASEALRPRGVWAAHIAPLKASPELGEPILEPLRADPERYVQDSVANWINDAAKSRPDWAVTLCARWRTESPGPATARIVTRGLRSLAKA
ncbi:DNA alkylation repair protein [Leucobacter luti]|nr:HEAT repeat domain-containing protein [Leucobacter luti]MBL3698743.1 DNA alkylation repair protein [Leucobacter luti]